MLWQKSLIAPTSDLISNLSVIAHRTQTVTLCAHCDHYLDVTGDRVLTGQSMDIVVVNSWGDILPENPNVETKLENGKKTPIWWILAKNGLKWLILSQLANFILNLTEKAYFLIYFPVSIWMIIYPWVMLTACQCGTRECCHQPVLGSGADPIYPTVSI